MHPSRLAIPVGKVAGELRSFRVKAKHSDVANEREEMLSRDSQGI